MKNDNIAKLNLEIDPMGRLGMNRQIANQIIEKINSGELCLNDRLPSELFLADYLKVSRDVVRRAYQILRESNFIKPEGRKGWVIIFPASENLE